VPAGAVGEGALEAATVARRCVAVVAVAVTVRNAVAGADSVKRLGVSACGAPVHLVTTIQRWPLLQRLRPVGVGQSAALFVVEEVVLARAALLGCSGSAAG
jgi:hypothetical protein